MANSDKYSGLTQTDSLRFKPDETNIPWMKYAREQLHLNEFQDAGFARQFALSFVSSATEQRLGFLGSIADESIGKDVAEENPGIAKFLQSFPPRRRPDLVTRKKPGDWHMTAWCAAFVNWCLLKAGIDVRGTATAAKWLEYGTPIQTPDYGCIVITKKLATTGSSSGHVGFCVEALADCVRLLGGNQSRAVTDSLKVPYEKVIGYRWPTAVNFLAAASDVA